jgi:spore maturation protein CgeB
MKLMNIADASASYPAYLATVAARFPGYTTLGYHDQHAVINRDHFVWGMPYHRSLGALGYEVFNVDRGIKSLQQAWAAENGLDPRRMSADDIVVEQARAFKPDAILYDPTSSALLRKILDDVPTIRLVLGWVGSALAIGRTWGMIDIMLTCAPESVTKLSAMGMKSRHVNHSFNPEVNMMLAPRNRRIPVSFVGSIVRRSEFHLTRERMLLGMCDVVPLTIYSPNVDVRPMDYAKAVVAGVSSTALAVLRRTGLLKHVKSIPIIRRAERVASPIRRPVHPRLAKRLRPGVYGREYFEVLRDSEISLNIHADTSPTYASNIRLYEATGAGSCLLTDWKSNLADLYEPDTEVAVYRSVEEAIEKAMWLIDHPRERHVIANAGMRRTLATHTFAHRAQQIDQIIREALRCG